MREKKREREPEFAGRLRSLPFVREVKCGEREGRGEWVELRTGGGVYRLRVERRGQLKRGMVNEVETWVRHVGRDGKGGVLVAARHVPRGAAEEMIGAKINFVDEVGNVHVELGGRYNWTVYGLPAGERIGEARRMSPAQMQLLIQWVTHPESVNWPVRQLEGAAGVSKSAIAQARVQMGGMGVVERSGGEYRLGAGDLVGEQVIRGYGAILRPKLFGGRFRAAEKSPEALLARLRKQKAGVRYAVTGGAAADLLQRYYRGAETVLYVEGGVKSTAQALRLLPDREGPVTLLEAFGEVVYWGERRGHEVAPPWLIYAELLLSKDPRAQEAAQEFRREYLE